MSTLSIDEINLAIQAGKTRKETLLASIKRYRDIASGVGPCRTVRTVRYGTERYCSYRQATSTVPYRTVKLQVPYRQEQIPFSTGSLACAASANFSY